MNSDRKSLGYSKDLPANDEKNSREFKKNLLSNQNGYSEYPSSKKNSEITKTNPISNQKDLSYSNYP
ncbi:hypothetical protein TSUD_379370 [Trifolium subterraneum]|uniref:Uncharacterized protein n=1 Tax=Trifolium subterraneum TaxID=3900 RepID=A0A2Z6PBJ5_TRISU|nr:hypothetical protein TSUD_379370 [Trifolium subterraneum]